MCQEQTFGIFTASLPDTLKDALLLAVNSGEGAHAGKETGPWQEAGRLNWFPLERVGK